MFSSCSAAAWLQQEKGPSSPPLSQPSTSHSSFTARLRLAQTPSCYQNGGEATTETPHAFLKGALRELLTKPKRALPVAGSCACRVARMAILLHFILPGWTVLGTGEEKKMRMRRSSSTGCAGVWPPQEEARLL